MNCPTCGAALTFADTLLDTETLKAVATLYYCTQCQDYWDSDQLTAIEEEGDVAYIIELLYRAALDDLIVNGTGYE